MIINLINNQTEKASQNIVQKTVKVKAITCLI